MENKIKFLGKSNDITLAEKLYNLICKDLEIKYCVAVLEKDFETKEKFDAIVYALGTEIKSFDARTYTYSVGQSDADICGFNFQKRENSKSIDLFSASFMGRVNIPLSSQFTEKSVLYCAAGFVAAGVSLPQVLKEINLKIR